MEKTFEEQVEDIKRLLEEEEKLEEELLSILSFGGMISKACVNK